MTGANGEVGHGLIPELNKLGYFVAAFDIDELDRELYDLVDDEFVGSVSIRESVEEVLNQHEFDVVFHLAAVLSTEGESDHLKAYQVNVDGTRTLFTQVLRTYKKPIKFIFPSSIAVYGLPNLQTKQKVKAVDEYQFLVPTTMYGITKLHSELLGSYYKKIYGLDFRCVRFPGIISADTTPSGGTSDFGPEMLHAAAKGVDYECFVRKDSRIPFMVMPDAVSALLQLAKVDKNRLNQSVYNVGAFSISANEIADIAKKSYPNFKIIYKPHRKRQAIVDSWPLDVDDSAAKRDWGWKPKYNKKDSFEKYLLPAIKRYYTK